MVSLMFLLVGVSLVMVGGNVFIRSLGVLLLAGGSSLVLGGSAPILGVILFLVYVGGIIVLFMYCLILTPLSKMRFNKKFFVFGGGVLIGFKLPPSLLSVDVFWQGDFVTFVGVLLFLVLLVIVEVIEIWEGRFRVCVIEYPRLSPVGSYEGPSSFGEFLWGKFFFGELFCRWEFLGE